MRRPWPLLLTTVFVILAASDLAQVAGVVRGTNDQPTTLAALHTLTAASAIAVAIALWRRSPRAPGLVWLWGVLTAVLILAVPVALEMPRAAWFGMIGSALVVLVLAWLGAWAARRVVGAG